MFKRTSEESWDGIKKIRELYPQLSEKQAIKINGEITAYIAQNARDEKHDIGVISDIIFRNSILDHDPTEHIKKCQHLLDGYTKTNKWWEFGENLWAIFLYVFSVTSLLTDAVSYIYPKCTKLATIVLVCVLVGTGALWHSLDKKTKKEILFRSSADTNHSPSSFIEKLRIFGIVSAKNAGSISFLIYCLYYIWKALVMFFTFAPWAQVTTLVMFGVFALIIIYVLIYPLYRTYRDIQKNYLNK